MKYKVYMHITPNGKRYIGLTGTSVEKRWRKGNGYYHHKYFYNAINKYGWENIDHIIIKENLTRDEAIYWEMELIKTYETTNPDKGYNLTTGGEFTTYTKEVRKNLSEIQRNRKINGIDIKLSYEIADEIRKLYATGKYTHAELGKIYGVVRNNITDILSNKTWVDENYEVPENPMYEVARNIRKDYATGKYLQTDLCKKYGMGRTVIHRIVKNKRWVEEGNYGKTGIK